MFEPRYHMVYAEQLGCWVICPRHYEVDLITDEDTFMDREITRIRPGEELDVLAVEIEEGSIELNDELPVFSDRKPNDTVGIWSWDGERMMVGTCSDDLEIVSFSDSYEML